MITSTRPNVPKSVCLKMTRSAQMLITYLSAMIDFLQIYAAVTFCKYKNTVSTVRCVKAPFIVFWVENKSTAKLLKC